MKIQTSALLKSCSVEGKEMDLPDTQKIELEFSAIDTGGGFRDAILDFSISIPKQDGAEFQEPFNECDIEATMQNPDDRQREATFTYQAEWSLNDDNKVEINGRLKDDHLSREVIGFMLHLLR